MSSIGQIVLIKYFFFVFEYFDIELENLLIDFELNDKKRFVLYSSQTSDLLR